MLILKLNDARAQQVSLLILKLYGCQVLILNLNQAGARPVSLLILKLHGAPGAYPQPERGWSPASELAYPQAIRCARCLFSTGMRLEPSLRARLSSSYMGRQVLILNLNEAGARPVSLLILKLYGAPGAYPQPECS